MKTIGSVAKEINSEFKKVDGCPRVQGEGYRIRERAHLCEIGAANRSMKRVPSRTVGVPCSVASSAGVIGSPQDDALTSEGFKVRQL